MSCRRVKVIDQCWSCNIPIEDPRVRPLSAVLDNGDNTCTECRVCYCGVTFHVVSGFPEYVYPRQIPRAEPYPRSDQCTSDERITMPMLPESKL